MEELPFDPELLSLEEMIISQRWQEPHLDEDLEDNEVFMIPSVPHGFRPAA